ncbi:hypothetical protein PR048_008046 [Dryococelus australis]|uniref:Uncharacterized protein n=1 Tax=Dryococelus australis TaxID=614101 RepID=A0ABQ9HW03_9NEOP|nr:hypothetical protein PR048_008046 [Dryococelus australis]
MITIDDELLCANFVCEINLPIRLADSFTKLVPEMFSDSGIAKSFHCGRTKTRQIIRQAIAATVEEEIINTMRKSLFALLIDGSTAIAVTRQMVIMVHFLRGNKVESQLYKVVAFGGKATRKNLFNVANKSFEEDGFPWQNF